MSSVDETLKNLQQFFDSKVREHGATPKGVDWNSEDSQFKRFEQLLYVVRDRTQPFTVLDYGSGWGALVKYLQAQNYVFKYIGYDMTPAVIEEAQKTFADDPHCTFTTDEAALQPVPYVVGSGLFNMRMNADEDVWQEHMRRTIERMWELATVGMAFNSLTSYSDPEYMRADLYYPSPTYWFDYCKRNLSRNVALLHDYDLYDFTIIVRR